ncbi:MAG: 16S rRNA (guanine(527)-N(7))-methyltransferase RsmG [Chloroflexi bacterium]|nr:16S rRNA (guanine(527)-N(7))-methyltransferase RsmG [Chloroflexota bacterium]
MCAAASLEWDDLPGLFPEFPAPGRWLPLLRRHSALVEAAAPRVRVTSVPPGEMVRRQYAESLELLRLCPEIAAAAASLADVGSGGGYPGMVAAVMLPETRVHLVEPLQKRARLLETMAADLGLTNVTVHALRAEEAGRGSLRDACEAVTARAVAELRELLEYTAPLCAPGGTLALPKGSALPGELEAAAAAMAALGCEFVEARPMRPEVAGQVTVAVFRKTAPTGDRYPRRPGMAGKRPL